MAKDKECKCGDVTISREEYNRLNQEAITHYEYFMDSYIRNEIESLPYLFANPDLRNFSKDEMRKYIDENGRDSVVALRKFILDLKITNSNQRFILERQLIGAQNQLTEEKVISSKNRFYLIMFSFGVIVYHLAKWWGIELF